MSRIGKKAIPLPANVEFNIDGQEISVKGLPISNNRFCNNAESKNMSR